MTIVAAPQLEAVVLQTSERPLTQVPMIFGMLRVSRPDDFDDGRRQRRRRVLMDVCIRVRLRVSRGVFLLVRGVDPRCNGS